MRTTLAFALAAFLTAVASAAAAQTPACPVGAYRGPHNALIAVTLPPANAAPGLRYTTLEGRRGALTDPASPVTCDGGALKSRDAAHTAWTHVPLRATDTDFFSGGLKLHGQLLEPPITGAHRPPLLVAVHGSEATSPIGVGRQFLLTAQGVTTFFYDKRGTGRSQGVYTQDFDLLARDAAAALDEARRLDAGRYSRAGFMGGSQGGWVAPKAALYAHADFVEVGFGVLGTAAEQDEWQVDYELVREDGFSPSILPQAHQVTDAARDVAASDFTAHFDELERVKKLYGNEPWFSKLNGQYVGELVRGEIAQAKSESPQVPWTYDGLDTMRELARRHIPQLWVLAQEDQLAPSAPTLKRLHMLQQEGAPIQVVMFPNTEHGIQTFTTDADGKRHDTGYADGWFRLLADWAKGERHGRYGDSTPADVRR
jgi:pimeloyl-ACP methyl ester carboxylesterase